MRGLGLAALAVVLLATAQLLAARRAANRAFDALAAAQSALQRTEVDAARGHLTGAEAALASVRARARSPFLRPLGLLPVVGSPVRALKAGGDAGREAAAAGRSLATAVESLPLRGGVDLKDGGLAPLRDGLLAAEKGIAAARVRLQAAAARLKGPSGAALPMVAGPAKDARQRIGSSLVSLERAVKLIDLLAELSAPSSDTRLLLLAQDTLELRATGGFIGSFGVIRVAGGKVELERYDSYEALPDPQPPLEAPAAMAPWLPRPWGLSNVNWWPDFPTTAARAKEAFARQGGGQIDGVIAITENVLRDLLEAIGPVQVPGYSEPVAAEGLEDRIVYEVELKQPADTPRKKFLIELAHLLFDRLFELQADEMPPMVNALGRAVSAGDLQVWFADRRRQEAIDGTVAAGQLPERGHDFLLMVDTNRSASKANKDLTRHATYRVTRTAAGDHVAMLDVKYENAGEESPVNPWYYGHVRVYAPRGARLLEGTTRGVKEDGVAEDGPYQVFSTELMVKPLSTVNLRLTYLLPDTVAPGGRYRLTWVRQPGTSRDQLSAIAGGREWSADRSGRILEVETNLRGNRVAEFLRRRWVVRALFN